MVKWTALQISATENAAFAFRRHHAVVSWASLAKTIHHRHCTNLRSYTPSAGTEAPVGAARIQRSIDMQATLRCCFTVLVSISSLNAFVHLVD